MWLIFPLVILTFVYRSKPLVGIVYAVLLTAWYSVNIIAFFDPTDRAMTELPIRATFFLLMGVLAALLGNNLRQQSAE
jgi:peptidoglycan/LPS O-acetylase OafA/YrhL